MYAYFVEIISGKMAQTKYREKTNIHSLWTNTRVNKYFPYLIQAFLLFIFSAAKPSLFVDLNRINFARETNIVLKRVNRDARNQFSYDIIW